MASTSKSFSPLNALHAALAYVHIMKADERLPKSRQPSIGMQSSADSHVATATDEEKLAPGGKMPSFKEVVRAHLPAAYNLARWLVRDPVAAEDLVQEAMLRALKYFPSFRGTNARGWMLRIVRNAAYAARRGSEDGLLFMNPLSGDLDSPALPEIADLEANPEMVVARAQDSERLQQLLQGLPIELRECLVLRELEELSYREIADITDVPMGTVMSRLWRARQLLMQTARREAI